MKRFIMILYFPFLIVHEGLHYLALRLLGIPHDNITVFIDEVKFKRPEHWKVWRDVVVLMTPMLFPFFLGLILPDRPLYFGLAVFVITLSINDIRETNRLVIQAIREWQQ